MAEHRAPDQGFTGPPMDDAWAKIPEPAVPSPNGGQPADWTKAPPGPLAATAGGSGLAGVQGLVLGAAAAAVGTYLWTAAVALTGYQIGFAAIGVGALVGAAVRFGSRGSGGTGLRAGSVGLTILAMAAAEVFVERQLYIQWLESQGISEPVPLLLPLGDMVAIVTEVVSNDPFTLVFWLLAAAASWRLSASSS